MARNNYKEAWGVVDHDGLNIKTVSDTRRAAIVNWLVTEANCFICARHKEPEIMALWDANRGEAVAKLVRIYVQ